MKPSKRTPIQLHLVLIIAGLVTLLIWPSLTTAMPLTAKNQLERAWKFANDVAAYTYQTTAIQTIHPTARVENIGRRVETKHIAVEGEINRPAESMQLELWPNGKDDQRVISLKIEDGVAYGRLQAEDEWQELDAPPTDLFAPGGDPLGFLIAAENVQEVSSTKSNENEIFPYSLLPASYSRYTFDLNSLRYANFMRAQLEDALRRKGELPTGISLDLSRQYVDMVGHGEIWVNADGLPVRQIIHLEFPPERGAAEWVEANITTDFRDWESGVRDQGFALVARRLWENPRQALTDPYSLLPTPYFPTAENLQHFGLALGIILLSLGLVVLTITLRRSAVFYGAIVGAVLLSMLVMPLMQANQVLAFTERQRDKAAEIEQYQATQQNLDAIRSGDLSRDDFNPLADPLANGSQKPESLSPAPSLIPSQQATITATTAFTTGYHSDSDGLTDDVEILELGTDPDDIDTDGDGISDSAEVRGFNLNGTQWYLNPLSMDSNGDGLSDLAECPNLGDVDENGDPQTPAGTGCDDTDNDGVPNAFDFDNDADGVPDSVDMSPNLINTLSTTAQDSITLDLSNYQTGTSILAEFQIRPPDEQHLWYSNNYLDWPDQDTQGQIMRVTDETLSDKGDILLSPMLEIEIPYDAANPSRGLPITDTVNISSITATTPFTTWIDQPALDLYGISLTQDEDDGTLHAYVPLVVIEDRVGDMPVAWGGQMPYILDVGSSGWGQAHTIRLLWMVAALTDSCDAGENDYDTYCASDSGNWVSQTNVIQTYYEDFTLTGLSVKEDYGMEAAIIAQTEATITDYENYLWVLSHHLQDTFLAGGLVSGSRFDIAEIERRFETGSYAERWGIPAAALNITTLSYPDQISGFADLLSNQIPAALANSYPGAAVNRQVNLLVAREESYRSAVWGSGTPVSVSGTAISVNLSVPEKRTFSSIKWTPYIYDGTGWDNVELTSYLADLETNLGPAIDLAEILDGATVNDATLTRQGAISFLKSYYLTLYQGLTALTQVDGVPAGTEAVVDADFAMNGQSAEKIVLDDTLGLMLAYFENEAAMLLDGQAYADEALETFTDPANLLAAMGEIDTGTVRLASEQLGGAMSEYITKKIYKITQDIHGTKTKYGTYSAKTAGAVTIMGLSAAALLYKTEALNLDDAMVVAYGSFTAAASFDVVAAVGALHKFKTAKYLITELDLLYDIRRLSKFSAMSGFILESGLAVGMTLFTGFSQNLFDTEPAAYALVAEAVAQVVVAVFMAVLALTPVGALISAVLGLIDAVIGLLCETGAIDAGETANSWICDGLTGAFTKLLTYVINDYTPLVDMEHDDRLDIVINEPTITQKTEAAGFVEGNQLNLSAVITTSLYMGSPNWAGYVYDWQWTDDNLKRASFVYRLQESETDISVDLDQTSWNVPAGRTPVPAVGIPEGKRFYKDFQASHTYTLGSPGVNQGIKVYLSEGFNVRAQNCWTLACYLEDYDDTFHIDMSKSLVFDVLPNTIAGFRELTSVGNDSYRLAWHDDLYSVQVDADNDGLRSKESGGPDPDDSLPDTDFDGLSDLFEYQNGSSLTEADADCDGLTDYWEAFYGTNPNQSDSDNDGLIDGEEMFHPNKIYPYKNSAPTNANPPPCSTSATSYSGGWDIVYDYAAGQPLTTWVSGDPNDADADGDNLTDSREKVYGYNPNVPGAAKILSLASFVESDSGNTPYVAPGGQVDYTAVISNELDNRYAFGLLQAEFPVDTVLKTQVIDTLAPLESITMTGSIGIGSGYSSGSYSMTVRSGAIIDPGTGRRLWLRFNESSGSTVFADSSLNDNQATCTVCPVANEQYAQFNRATANQALNVDTANGNFKTTTFSLGAWVYPTDLNSSTLIQETDLYNLDIVGAGSYAYPRARVYLNGHTLTVTGSATDDVEQNAYNHLMFTFYLDEATSAATLNLYLNGELIDTASYTAGLPGTSSTMVIGDSFSGYLDDVEYYNRVLSAAEIDALVNQPVLDIDFGTLADLSGTQAAVTCSGDSCPAGDDQWGSFDQLDYVSVSDPALNLSGGQFSVATWIKPKSRDIPFDPAARSAFAQYLVDTSRDWQGVFGANQYSDSNHYPTLYVSDAGQLWMGFRNNNTDCTYKTATNTVNVNGWNHLIITYNGTQFFVYVNGVLKGSSGICGIAPPSLSSFTIGRPNSQNYFYLDNLHVTGLEDAGDCEEIFLDRDGAGIWNTEVCKNNLHTTGPEVNITKKIDKALVFPGTESHSFRLWEEDGWGNPNDIYINTYSINNTNLFNGSTSYSDGNSEGELNWSLSNDYFEGELDEFRLYNYTLNPDDVTNLYNTTAAGLELTFDEPPGQATFSDSSGNGFSATCSQQTNACPDSGIPGRDNQALRFDGGVADNAPSDGVADYVTIEASTQKLGLYDSSFTVMAWIKADDLSGDRAILGTPTRSANQGLHLILRGGVPYMGFYANDTAGSTVLTTGVWHHLAWVYDKETGAQSIYLDGELDGSETGHAAFTGTGAVEVGRAISDGNSYFDGLIDDLTIVKRAYDQTDVQAAMAQAPFINLHLDEDLNTQTFANDSPYTAYNGTCASTDSCPQAGDKGQIREALVFDGNDALTLPTLAQGVFQVNQFSAGMWLNPRTLDTAADMQLLRIRNNGRLIGDVQINSDGDVSFDISSHCGFLYEQFYDEVTGVIAENSWQHVMLTNQDIGSDKKISLYVNGQLKGAFTNWGGSCDGPFDITVGQNLVGNLDELVIYNTVLSDDEIAALYAYQNSWYDMAEQHQIIVDADAPAVWLDLYTGHISATTQLLSIGTQDATSSIVSVEYNIDGAGWQSATRDGQSWLFSFDQTDLGNHTVALRATDSVGNNSGTVNESVTVDGTPPTLTVDSSLTNSVQQASTSLALNGTVSDSQSGAFAQGSQVHLADRHGDTIAGWQPAQISGNTWTAAYPFPNLRPYGNYNLQVTAVDNVGNAITQTATLPLDGYGPYADVLLNTTLITQSGAIISGTLSDVRHLPQSQSLHLSFEESSGATEFLDGSRNHFSATCSGAACPTAGQSGQLGQSLRFDGSNDALVISGTTAVSVTEHLSLWNDSFTVMAWLNPDTVSGNQAVLGTNTNAGNQGLFVGLQDGRPHLGFTNDDTTATASINSGQWTHVAWRYDHDKGEQALFVNGTQVISSSGHSGFEGEGPLYVGQALNGNRFDGRIDDLVIYKTAVSDDNIYNIANPLAVNVSQVELRFRHAEERDQADNAGFWYLADLATTGQPFSTWQYSVGANLEGPYRIDLRTTDELGNVALIKDAWTGDFDTMPPRLNFTFAEADSYYSQVVISCQAEDYNLTTTGWQCPLTDTYRTAGYLNDLWFADFGITDKLVELATTAELVITSSSRSSMTACDLVGHCVTKSTVQKPGGVGDNLQLWLKANDGLDTTTDGMTITTWLDQSENDYQATQPTAADKPTYQTDGFNGYPVVRFDGSSDYLSSTFTLDPAAEGFSLWAVARPDTVHDGVMAAQQTGDGPLLMFTAGQNVSTNLDGAAFPRNSSYSGDTTAPVLYGLSYATSGNLTHYRNGAADGATGGITAGSATGAWLFGRNGDLSSQYLDGDVAEIIVYTGTLAAESRARVDSYLALKYGVTLTNTQDYVDSTGIPFWEAARNVGYYHDVAGIGRDNSSGLAQWQSKSVNDDAVVTMVQGSNIATPEPIFTDQAFLVWGNNNGSLTGTTTITVAGTPYYRLERIWRVQSTGQLTDTVVSFDLTGYSPDMHPNWIALAQASSADFSDAVLHTRGATLTGDVATFSGVQFSDGAYFSLVTKPNLSVYNNVTDALDYDIVYELDIPQNANYYSTYPAYTIDNSDTVGPYDRVAYYMELVLTGTNESTWAYVSMPAFSLDPRLIGIPVVGRLNRFEQTVTDMVVDSNLPGLVTGTVNTGNIEFWFDAYDQTADSALGGDGATFDFDDQRIAYNPDDPFNPYYGSFQIHNYGISQTIMAWNGWNNSAADDIGIGNSSGPNPDWTGANNSGDYAVRHLYVLARRGVIAEDDAYTTTLGKQLVVGTASGLLANDSQSVTASLFQAPAEGSVSIYPYGGFVYTPTLSFIGDDTFTYVASDGVVSDTATVTVTVGLANCFVESTGDNLTDFSSIDASAVQAAVDAASPGDTLKIAGTCAGVQTVNSSDQLAWLDQSLTMQGGYTTTHWLVEPDSDLHPTILDAESSGRVLLIDSGSITLSHLTLINGATTGNGGGIFNGGTLVISRSLLSNHSAQYGGAIYNNGVLTATNSTFTANSVENDPGSNDSNGGAINNSIDATLLLERNTFTANSADQGGAVANSGGSATLINNTIYSNTGRYAGGGLYLNGSFSRVEYNTIAANQTGAGDTSNDQGGGVYQEGGASSVRSTFVRYNIFDNNSDLDCRNNSSFLRVGYNVLAAESGCTSTTNLIADPQLGPLADNGGDTQTMAITADSPAYNPDGSSDFFFCPATDQRGYPRPQGPGCDLGAFEVDYVDIGLEMTIQPTYPQPGDVITYTITFANNSSGETITGIALTDTLSAGIINTAVQTAPDAGVVMTYTPASSYAWSISNLAPGQGGVITLSGQVDSLGVGATISNTATITGSEDAANFANNSQTLTSVLCYGTSITVTSAADSGPGSLRQALTDLCEGGVITFDNDTTIHLSSTLTLERNGVTIDGSGHTITLSGDSGNDGSRDVGVVTIEPTGVVTLTSLNIISGSAVRGGGINNQGVLALVGSSLYDNSASSYGGGLYSAAGSVTIIQNSTIVSNTADVGGGISSASIGGNPSVITMTHVTLADNTANWTGGLDNGSLLYLRNSIIANNSAVNSSDNCDISGEGTAIVENINTIIEGGDCNSGDTLSGLLSDDPLLGTLAYHGGTTLNYSLLPDSPAITTAETDYCLATDQRGAARAQYSSDCDRGAHEADGANPMLSKSVSPALITTGQIVTYTLTITNAGNITATGLVITDIVPAALDDDISISASGLSLTPIGGSSYAWNAADLAPGQSGAITLSAALIGGGTVTNTASISSSNDIYSGDNTAEVGGYICGEAGLVTNANDSGPGSLRDMLAYGCFDHITFADDTTIHLNSTLTISNDVTIDGSGHTVTLSGDSGGDGSRDVRVMVISPTTSVTLTQLNIVSGTAIALPDNLGGGIYNLGRLALFDSTLADNTAIYGGGLSHDGVSAVLSNSTIVNNYAIMTGGGIDTSGVLTLTHVTVAGNSADDFDGTGGLENSGTLYAYNSILADNSGPFTNNCSLTRDFIGTIAVNINNLIEGSECNSGDTLSGLLGADPQLGALDYHGGNTLSYALSPTSPALDTASTTYCPVLDQRGVARPQGAACDRGAFELEQPHLILTKQVTPANIVPGGLLTYTLAFTNIGDGAATNTVITDDLPLEILTPVYTWTLDGDASLTRTTGTTYSWAISGTLASGQGGIITVTGQLSSPLAAEVLTNSATIAEIEGGYTLSATAAVTLTVDNVAPVVAANVFTIAENAAIGAEVGVVTGTDANLDVTTYSITGGNGDGIFAIDGSSGQITVTDTTYLNYESDSQYLLTVAATDGDLTGTNTIAVNITDTSTDLTLSKTVIPAAAGPGDTITYTLNFTNTGDDKANDVVIFDQALGHLASLAYQLSLANDVIFTQADSTTYVWELGDVPAQTGGVLTLTGVLSQPLAAGILTNTATITTTSDESNVADNVATTTLTINNVDPVLTPTILTVSEAAVNGTVVGAVDAVDGNGDALTYSITGGNSDGVFALNSSTGLITVTDRTNLSFEITPQYVLTVEVSVGTFVGTTVVTINVSDVDADLSLVKTVTPSTALPGEAITYTLAFSNAGVVAAANVVINDALPSQLSGVSYQLSLDSGVAVTPTNSITYEWAMSDLAPGQGGVITITGLVNQPLAAGTRFTNTAAITTTSDETGPGSNSAEAGLTVGNAAPVLDAVPLQTITETETLTFTASANDANGDSLTFGLYNAPGGATIDSSTGEVTWTPAETQTIGLITLVVTDSGGLTGTTTALVTVIEVNNAPALATIPSQTIGVTDLLTFTVVATDTDWPVNNLTYSLVNAPGGAALDAATGVFSWTPTTAGIYTVTVQVADDGLPILTDTTEVSITVTADVTPPDISGMILITPTNGITVTTARPTFDWEDAVDAQSGVISYTLLITSSNDSINVQEAGTTITTTVSNFTPSTYLTNGVYTWTVRAHDGAGNVSDWVSPPATFNIEVGSGQIYLPLIMRNGSSE